jgi:hypothetical protein
MSIHIGFSDFWPGFDFRNVFVFRTIVKNFDIIISRDPEYLIFSDYGQSHLDVDAVKVRFHGENRRPDFNVADFIIGFDYVSSDRYLRVPLYVNYQNEKYDVRGLENQKSKYDVNRIIKEKTEFCCFIVSNGSCDFRNRFFEQLNAIKPVASGGGFRNNIGGRVENKIEFMRKYKFVIAFENSSHPGYTTEKLLHPYYSNAIPIYWGSPNVDEEFDPMSFVWVKDARCVDRAIGEIIEIDSDIDKFASYIERSPFYGGRRNHYFSEERICAFFSRILETRSTSVSSSTRRHRKIGSMVASQISRAENWLIRRIERLDI